MTSGGVQCPFYFSHACIYLYNTAQYATIKIIRYTLHTYALHTYIFISLQYTTLKVIHCTRMLYIFIFLFIRECNVYKMKGTATTAIAVHPRNGRNCSTSASQWTTLGMWPMYTAGIDLGPLMHVLYPPCNLICAISNSRPSEELTFHLSCCYFAAGAA